MGARWKVRETPPRWRWSPEGQVPVETWEVDIQSDRRGQFFELRGTKHLLEALDVSVMHCEPRHRHLLMLVRSADPTPTLDRFLCGHDEREWFVAAVPGGASNVSQAMEALQPKDVRAVVVRHRVSTGKRFTRKNRAFRRQGEWFFVPEPSLVVPDRLVLRNEPIRRGRGKPHWVAQLFRKGGTLVHVCYRHPGGVTPEVYQSILKDQPEASRWNWRVMMREPEVYARGAIRHPDHQTIVLPTWHRVWMNTESMSRAMQNLAFLD